jgi:hypothetical protein
MSKKIFSNITISISVVFVVAVIGLVFFSGVANATITGAAITASSTRDSVVGTSSAVYKVVFDTNITAVATTVTITFPSGFTITDGSIATSTLLSSSSVAGYITVNNVDVVTSSQITGSFSTRTIVIQFATGTNLGAGNVRFRLTSGIQNATASGVTATSSLITNASGEAATTTIAGVTLIADTATKLGFTTQPAAATSGIAFVTQPIVAVQDQYGNTVLTDTSTVTLTATTTDGSSPGTLGGTLTKAAVAGVANFASNGVKFTAVADGQTFKVLAADGSLTSATSSELTANVVATKLVFTTQPVGAVSGIALSTQPVITAQNVAGTTDTGFTSTVSLSPTSTTALGSVTNASMAAVSGVAAFTGAIYNPSADNETFQLSASGGGLTTGDSTSLVARFYHGVGGGGGYVAPVVTPIATTTVATTTPAVTTTSTTTVETTPMVVMENLSGRELLNSLIERLKALLQAASSAGIQLPESAKAYLTPAAGKLSEITKNLSLGSIKEEVKLLQQFLNSNGFTVAQSGLGSSGNETTRFGGLTRAALAKYQKSVGISPASGLFGPITRAYLKSIGF